VLSYAIRPLGDPVLLGVGVALVFCAVVTNSFVYRSAGPRKGGGSRGGLAMCFAAGVLYSMCGPLVAKALAPPRPVGSYGAALLYGAGCLVATGPLLLYLARRPLGGVPLLWKEYAGGSVREHVAGLAGGLIWGAGMVLNFLAAGLAGMAVAGAVGQANPLVAALWGIVVWREFRGASRRTMGLLALMVGLYSAGLVVLGLSFRAG
jgi:glucose uptake protein